jgi:hypothetical protein
MHFEKACESGPVADDDQLVRVGTPVAREHVLVQGYAAVRHEEDRVASHSPPSVLVLLDDLEPEMLSDASITLQ